MRPSPSRPLARLRGLAAAVFAGLVLTACADLGPDLPTGLQQDAERPAAVGDLMQQDFGPAIAAANRYSAALMRNPNIVGTAVGLNDAGLPSVRLFLMHGQVTGLPDRLDDVPVSSVVTGPFVLRQDRTARARPAPIGFSVGHPDITAGTLGARVVNGQGDVFILSNNHILANTNNATLGDPILQPGAYDGGSQPGDVIGTLHDFQEISFSSNNTMDAAIALVDGNDVSGSTPATASYGSPGTNPVTASLGMGVQKYGRTTGHTTGTVEGINVTVTVCFRTRGPFQCAQSATFVDQISISDGSFSAGGDSGSLIVRTTASADPVGLLFAGSSTRTLANPIGAVLDRFGVSIDPGEGGGNGGSPGNGGNDDDENGNGDVGDFELSVNGYKVRGVKQADLSWSGSDAAQIDIYRDGSAVATVSNTGTHTDSIGTRGGGSHTYRVCEAGTDTCSAQVTISF